MSEFSHEELQQVIRKYDSEYKRIKKSMQEHPKLLAEMEDRAVKAERELASVRDEKVCLEENVERMKEHIQGLMRESEEEKKAREEAEARCKVIQEGDQTEVVKEYER